MDMYHAWCDLRPGVRDIHFHENVATCMNRLHAEGLVESWRLTPRKLGLGAQQRGDWHLMIEVRELRQLEDTFHRMATRGDPEEGIHQAMNALVTGARFSLTRDLGTAAGQRGQERV